MKQSLDGQNTVFRGGLQKGEKYHFLKLEAQKRTDRCRKKPYIDTNTPYNIA